MSGTPVGYFDRPWALAANGLPIPTSYRIEGSTIVQVVEHLGAEYPVVADPHWTWGWVTGTVYLNKKETNQLAFGTSLGAMGLGFSVASLAALPLGSMSADASYVAGNGNCVKFKIYPTGWYVPGEYGGRSGDGYCK
jgi:hypothetical protein